MPLQSMATYEYTTTNIPAFLSKLWTLVEDDKYNELIAWDISGFSFHVFDQTRFAREILPRFFKHNNMASFIRQLNMYGFRKVNSIDHGSLRNEKEDMEFHHPYFVKDKEQFLEYIKRKVPDISKQSNQNALNYNNQQMIQQVQQQQQQQLASITSNLSNNPQMSIQQFPPIKQDQVKKVLDDVSVIQTKQKIVDESLFTVKKENEALWKELATLRQKFHHQQQIVNKLIHFLVHLVNPSSMGNNLKRAKPLMIDSHTATSLINGDEGIYDEIDGDDFINTKLNNSNARRRQLVELEEENSIDQNEDLTTDEVFSPSYSNIGVINKNDLYNNIIIDDAEIETINNAKTQINTNNYIQNNNNIQSIQQKPESLTRINLSSHNSKPLVKRLKTSDFQFFNNNSKNLLKNQNNNQNSQLLNTKAIMLNNTNTNSSIDHTNSTSHNNSTQNVQIPEILDTNLFINSVTNSIEQRQNNTNNGQNLINSINLIEAPSNNNANSPIVSLPNSPMQNNLNPANNMNIMMINENNNNSRNNTSNDTKLELKNNNESTENNSLERDISSSTQMNDHIESLQIDLNSIKDFLTNNSYPNQSDTYNTINSLFSPNNPNNNSTTILDQIDNDQFNIEAATHHHRSPENNTFIQNEIVNSMISPESVNSRNQNTNNKIIGKSS